LKNIFILLNFFNLKKIYIFKQKQTIPFNNNNNKKKYQQKFEKKKMIISIFLQHLKFIYFLFLF